MGKSSEIYPKEFDIIKEKFSKNIIHWGYAKSKNKYIELINKSDIILLGVSRTSKTPTSIYLANRGFKTSNIPLINNESLPYILKKNPKFTCIVGLTTEPERLVDIRRNRMTSLREKENTTYTDFEKISKEVEEAKKYLKNIIGQLLMLLENRLKKLLHQ